MYKPYHRIKHQLQECTKKEKKKHLTLASRVFPVPGAPVKRIPCKYVRVRLYNVQITKNRWAKNPNYKYMKSERHYHSLHTIKQKTQEKP
jgi:hypothetical protein